VSTVKVVAVALLAPLAALGIYFIAAGTWDRPPALGILVVLWLFCGWAAVTMDRGLIRERVKPGPGSRDHLTRPIATLLLFAHWVLAGLDVGRFQWSPIPVSLQWIGLAGYALAMAGMMWVMRVNPFYSSVVRIQSDRGHRAITAGPYRFVRHPGYTFTVLAVLSGALALGSWVGMVPLVGVLALFIRRTLLEDRMLHDELGGYAEYAERVRYRLVAGVF
jgi:protein-S-isoprenylcysteine O-methyltransferase Ste14